MTEASPAKAETSPKNITHTNVATGSQPDVLPRIYDEQINIVNYRRSLDAPVIIYCEALVAQRKHFNVRSVISASGIETALNDLFPPLTAKQFFVADLGRIIDMYACLFDLEEVGLRVQVLDRAMCPRFHVDKLGCRLVSTYYGTGSEWLNDCDVDRRKLGKGSKGLPDEESGLFSGQVQQTDAGDILLLKGEGWFENEGAGIVHRSPAVMPGEKRLVVTIDFA